MRLRRRHSLSPIRGVPSLTFMNSPMTSRLQFALTRRKPFSDRAPKNCAVCPGLLITREAVTSQDVSSTSLKDAELHTDPSDSSEGNHSSTAARIASKATACSVEKYPREKYRVAKM